MEGLESKNYYELLGLSPDATIEMIREAYKEIARVYHPDSTFYTEIVQVAMSDEDQKVFKIVTNAYNTLINPQKRAEYDALIPKNLRGWEGESATATQTQPPPQKKPARRSGFGEVRDEPENSETHTDGPKSIHDMIRDRKHRVAQRQRMLIAALVGFTLLLVGAVILVITLR